MKRGHDGGMEDRLAAAMGNAYSMESMEAHGAEGRSTRYIGSRLEGNRIYDYYEDEAGQFWFRCRMVTAEGIAVSEEEYIFGRRIKSSRKKWRE